MEGIFTSLQNQFPFFSEHRYLLLLVATMIDGFGTFLLAGLLVSLRALPVVPTFIILVIGDILNGMAWYALGFWGGYPFIEWLSRHSKRVRDNLHRVRTYATEYTGRAVLVANMTALTTLTNALVGTFRYPFGRFMIFNTIGSFFKPSVILFAGYFYGQGYRAVFSYIDSPVVFIFAGLLALPLMLFLRWILTTILDSYLAFWDNIIHAHSKFRQGLDKFINDGQDDDESSRK